MNANATFKTILHQIESSHLNYSMSKTPFSASISLKSSFIKRFEGEEIKPEVSVDARSDVEKLRQENGELKVCIKNLEKLLASQKAAIDDNFKQAKDNSKIAEEEMAVHREEWIQIKKEKNKLGAQVKTLQVDNDHLISEIKFYKNEAEECNKALTKSTKKHEEKLVKIERENEHLKVNEKDSQTQILELKQKIEQLKPSVKKKESGTQTESSCNLCAKIFLAEHELIQHVKSHHCKKTKDTFSQTSEVVFFLEYECFYCGFLIESENSLLEHRVVCKPPGDKDFIKNVKINVKSENRNQMELPQSYLLQIQAHNGRPYQCDICQESFDYTTMFEMHKMFSHQGHG